MDAWLIQLIGIAMRSGLGGLLRSLGGLWKIHVDENKGSITDEFKLDVFAFSIVCSIAVGLAVFYMRDIQLIKTLIVDTVGIPLESSGAYILIGFVGMDLLDTFTKKRD